MVKTENTRKTQDLILYKLPGRLNIDGKFNSNVTTLTCQLPLFYIFLYNSKNKETKDW